MKKEELKQVLYYVDKEEIEDEEFIDDCFLHVTRNGIRFVFYNGQVEKKVESLPILQKDKHLKKAVKLVEDLID